MEDLIATQYQLMQSIEGIFINFGKDGPERKTYSSIQRRLTTLGAYWNEFNSNHSQIIDYQDVDHEYFKQNCHQRTSNYCQQLQEYLHYYSMHKEDPKMYEKPMKPNLDKLVISERSKTSTTSAPQGTPAVSKPSTLQQGVTAVQPVAGTSTSADPQPPVPSTRDQQHLKQSLENIKPSNTNHKGTSSKLDEMLRKQKSNFKAFSRTVTNINLNMISEKWQYEDVIKNIEARWTTIDSLHWDIDSELYEEDEDYNRTFNTYEQEYNEIKQVLNQKKWSASYKTQSTPTMDIPTFNGDYHKWVSFKDLFVESIHSNFSMSNAQKMQFLKSKVKGEAEKLINHLNISSENYQICWEILNHRYSNTKLIFSSHVNILMTLPSMQQQTATHIKRLHDTSKECLNAIKALGVDISSWDPLIVHILSQKLDCETHKDYIESLKQPRELPSLTEFFEFLENKFTSLEASRRKQDSNIRPLLPISSFPNKQLQYKNNYFNKISANTAHNSKPTPKAFYAASAGRCPNCSGKHGIFNCDEFLRMPNEMKLKTVNNLHLCINCLYDHHGNKCHSLKTCSKCTKHHNTLLHDALAKSNSPPNKIKDSVNVSQNKSSEILLATALIKVLAADGTHITMRALIDQGSQISLITENAAQRLKLPRRRCHGVVFGLGAHTNNSKGSVEISASAVQGDFTFNTEAIIMKNLINNLPNHTFSKPTWTHIEHITLADPEFHISRPVDLLLGADIYSLIIQGGIIKGENDSQPIAQQTQLGWLLCGHANTCQYQCNVVLNNIDDIQRFWSIEDIGDEDQSNMSQEEHHCIKHYRDQTTRQKDGRYIVRLPMKPNTLTSLGESKHKAIAQFRQLEKKFTKDETIAEGYKTFINEYINLGHMTLTNNDGNQTPHCYLPHHCVIKSESTTTALRVVFNASSPTSSGVSLNDVMYSGPNLQQDLLSLILKWRQYEIAFTADIEKMFRQIMVHHDDQNLQKIIWRDNSNELLREYKLTSVTYGTKAAPFLAMMTLKQLASDEGHKYLSPAKQVLEEDFYMDDLLSGSHSISKAMQLQADLISLLKSGGFNLRKWSSNKPELRQVAEGLTAETNQEFTFKYPESTKTLGLSWNPQEDLFSFKIKLQLASTTPITKRVLLSEISKIFDPLGWLSPVTIKLKLLFQKVWLQDMEWSSELPEEFGKEWVSIKEDLDNINNIKVQRWLNSHEREDIELHGFCDSSTKAYACVIYYKVKSKIETEAKKSSIIIAAAKARLVPIKKEITLPRLELMSCRLLTQLMAKVIKSLNNHNIKVFGWTDSTAALGWIQGDSNRWKTFVANRVEQIKSIMPPECWRYVKSTENPADCASRGITVKSLQEHPLWWTGPSWLSTYQPTNQEDRPTYVTTLEIKKTSQSNVTTMTQDDVISNIVNNRSNFVKATRVLAWILRVVSSNRLASQHLAYLSVSELLRARQVIIRHYQLLEFGDEISCLKTEKSISAKSKILSLNPFIDEDGLLRVGGRLKHAEISKDKKHPLIIPHAGHLTTLLIDQAHRDTYHGGARLTLSRLRNYYWVIGGNRAVKKHIRACVTCKKNNPVKQHQIMGDLPAARSKPTRPFLNTGVDFTGFVDVKTNKGRGVKTSKGYIAVFVCMVTKAVHLELVSDLSSSAFLAALRRMAARRGAPRHIYCDNGTNFVGASRILQQEFLNLQAILDEDFYSQVTEMAIEFHFNAPSWPSAGGLWESAVKSLKHHLRRVVGEQKLTYEEYATLLSQIEACLNTRPLCAISEDPEDIDFLTPAHFLASGPTLTIIETERDERTRWQLTQKIFSDIWKRWQNEYLCQLSARSKWQQPQENQQIGDVVIIHDANLPAGKWSLGRVIELHPGKDGRVRVVSVKTKNAIIQRPIVKLSTLPVNISQKDHKSNNHHNQKDIKAPTNNKPKMVPGIKTLAFTLLTMMLILPARCTYNIAQLTSNQTIYFDKITDMHLSRNEWNLIVYYDMNPYWEGSKMINNYLDSLRTICNKDKLSLCDAIIMQLRHGVMELDHYNRMLLGQQNTESRSRARRGLINVIGNVANQLFGVLDDKFAEQYQKDIQQIRLNQKHLATLWRNQTSVIEAEHNVLQRIESTMDKQNKIINQHILQLQKVANSMNEKIQNLANTNEFTMSAFIAHSVLLNLRSIQDYLLDTITDLHFGSFNIHLITPDQLTHELNIISGQLPKDLSLPINSIISDLPKLYHLLKIKAKMTTSFFIFEIKIPLIARDYFEIYRLIPIQHESENNMISIQPVSEYVAMNIQKDSFITMDHSDLQACNQYDDSTILCPLQRPIYHITSDKSLCVKDDVSKQCITNIMTCQPTWSQLHVTNTHLYSCCESCTVRIICGSQVTSEQLNGSGIINLNEGCIMKHKAFTIFSHKQQGNRINTEADVLKIEIPSINHIIELELPNINMTKTISGDLINHTEVQTELKRIGSQIDQLKSANTADILADEFSLHDITQYVLINIIILTIICAGIALTWRRIRRCSRHTVSAANSTAADPRQPAPALPIVVTIPPPQPVQGPSAAPRPSACGRTMHRDFAHDTSSDGDIEMADRRYAKLADKSVSPSFKNHFKK